MLQEFVQKILTLAEPHYRMEDDGRVYVSRQMAEIMPPEVKPFQVQTLAGLRDLYKLHDANESPAIILIQDHATVWMVAKQLDEWRRRAQFVKASLPVDPTPFRFGNWMDPEEFVIGLQTKFSDSEYGIDLKKVVKLVSGLAAEAVTISNDDGVSQQVVTKQGMVTKGEERVSPRVSLAPYRTFREVAQPTSEFVLRLRGRQGQMPMCALFEADGGEWKNDAVHYIKEYFQKELEGADIVA
jgi:hypothetical protein